MTEVKAQRILIVEDDEDLGLVLAARLRAQGYEVHTETYGSTALGYAADHHPDLVILDVVLPDLRGDMVCEELRELCQPDSPAIIMFTGLDAQDAIDEGFSRCANALIEKRSAPEKLFNLVEQFLTPCLN